MYKPVELYDEPEREIEEVMDLYYSEMTSFQRSFLCGIIKEKRPGKIVEIGVSAGGTTALIVQCLKLQRIKSEIYSVDLMEQWYRNQTYETGFIAKTVLQECGEDIEHEFMLGKSIPFFLEQIGGDIDFLILDTTHALPGELLDFIVCLPFLKNGCTVVMHDTIESHLSYHDEEIASKLLFDVVKATDKYFMWEEDITVTGLPNITAFQVDTETRRNVRDLFSSLTSIWGYMLSDNDRQKYRESIQQNYGNEYLQLFDRIEVLQRNTFLQKEIRIHYGKDSEYLKMKWKKEKNVILYGAGHYANIYYQWGVINHLNICGCVISDDQTKCLDNKMKLPVYYLSELPFKQDECAIVYAIDKSYQGIVLQNLRKLGYENIL